MEEKPLVEFAEYTPDQPKMAGGANNIQNVVPAATGYRPMPSLSAIGTTLSSTLIRSAYATEGGGLVTVNYVGADDYIYRRVSATYSYATTTAIGTDISFSASYFITSTTTDFSSFNDGDRIVISGSVANDGSYTVSGTPTSHNMTVRSATIASGAAGPSVTIRRRYSGNEMYDRWEFVNFRNRVITTNYTDPVQATDTLGGTGVFNNLAGGPDKARHIGVVGEFVVLGYLNDGTEYPNRLQWSGISDPDTWGVSAADQSDYQDLFGEGGAIMGIASGDTGYIFQKRSIWTMDYVGPPAVFAFREVEKEHGCYASGSIIRVSNNAYYLSFDGFRLFNGAVSQPIGKEKVDNTFFADLDRDYIYNIHAAHDPQSTTVFWAYPGSGHTSGIPNKILCYDYVLNKWSIINQAVKTIYQALRKPDPTVYQHEELRHILGAINTGDRCALFTGVDMTATLETREVQHVPGRRAQVNKIRPIIDSSASASLTLAIGTRDVQTANVSYGSNLSTETDGQFSARSNARYHRYKMTIASGFNEAIGLQVDYEEDGER